MTTGVLDRLPLEEITAQARTVSSSRPMARLLIASLYLLGRAAARCSIGLRMAAAAVKVGWTETRAEFGIEPRSKRADGRADARAGRA